MTNVLNRIISVRLVQSTLNQMSLANPLPGYVQSNINQYQINITPQLLSTRVGQLGIIGLPSLTIDPTEYFDGINVSPVPAGSATVMQILVGALGQLFLQQIGSILYPNLTQAIDAINIDNTFQVPGDFTIIARIAILGTCTNLDDRNQAIISFVQSPNNVGLANADFIEAEVTRLAQGVINTGLLKIDDTFNFSVLDASTLRIAPIQHAVFYEQITFGNPLPYVRSFPEIDFDLNSIVVPDGNYVRFVGISYGGIVSTSDTPFSVEPAICQLGYIYINSIGGVVTFLNATHQQVAIPELASTSNLDHESDSLSCNVLIAPVDTSMQLLNTPGKIVGESVNWPSTRPNRRIVPAQDPMNFARITPVSYLSTTAPAITNTVVTTDYWNGTALVPLSTNTSASVQRVIITSTGEILLQVGEQEFTDLPTAIISAPLVTFTSPTGTALIFIELCRFAAIKVSTDISDEGQARFFGSNAGSAQSGGGGTYSDADTRATTLVGLTLNNTQVDILDTDSVLIAFGKLQSSFNSNGVTAYIALDTSTQSPQVVSQIFYRFENFGATVRMRGVFWASNATEFGMGTSGVLGVISNAAYRPTVPNHFSNSEPNIVFPVGVSKVNTVLNSNGKIAIYCAPGTSTPGRVDYFFDAAQGFEAQFDCCWSV